MPPDESAKIENRSRFAGLSTRATLSLSIFVLAAMPVAYFLFAHWSIITVWLFLIVQLVVICQGVAIVIFSGLQQQHSKVRYYGVCLVLYGMASIGMTFWFACLVALGGPAREQLPAFLAILWLLGAGTLITAAVYIRRKGANLLLS